MKDYINNIQTDMKNEHQYKIIDLKEPIYFFLRTPPNTNW
jgi:hypothetical protein